MRKGRKLNRSEAAEFFGVAPGTVDAWVKRGMPAVKRATGRGSGANVWQFDSAQVGEWLRVQAVVNATGNLDKVSIEEIRKRKLRAEAALAELDYSERRGELVPVEEATLVWCRIVGNFKARILAIPSKLAGTLASISDPAVIHDRIESELHEALTELSSDQNIAGFMAALEKTLGPNGNGESDAALQE